MSEEAVNRAVAPPGAGYCSSPPWLVRPYEEADFEDMARLHREAFPNTSEQAVRFSMSAPACVFVAEAGGDVLGTAMTVGFGSTAWIGGVVVTPAWQRRGIGTALTEHSLKAALDRAPTVMLLALEPARRLYARLGFVDECTYGTWVLAEAQLENPQPEPQTAAPPVSGSRPRPPMPEGCLELDHLATGEDRAPYLRQLPEAGEVTCVPAAENQPGRLPAAYKARLPWGAGPIISTDPGTGRRLVKETLAAYPATRVEFPDANTAGTELMNELGLMRVDDDYRMRFGPPVAGFHPELIYKVLTPMVG